MRGKVDSAERKEERTEICTVAKRNRKVFHMASLIKTNFATVILIGVEE